jgi:hypothetical protein
MRTRSAADAYWFIQAVSARRTPRRKRIPAARRLQFPAGYTLKWIAVYLAVALVLAAATWIWIGDRWFALAAVPAVVLVRGARALYERDIGKPGSPGDHD